MKKNYLNPEMTVTQFDCENVVTTSAPNPINLKTEIGGVSAMTELEAQDITIFN